MNAMFRVLAIGFLIGISAHHALATPLIGSPSGTITSGAGAGAGYAIGYRFVVGSNNLSVDALGIWDHNTNGLSIAHDVAIYTDTGTQLAVATVPAGTGGTAMGEYLYTSITPIILTSGIAYRISTFLGTGEDYVDAGAAFSVDAAASSYASFSSHYFGMTAVVSFPAFDGLAPGGYIGPNLNFTVVPTPEPNSAILACLGCVAILLLVRRRVTVSKTTVATIASVGLILLSGADSAQATPVSITNSTFEAPDISPNPYNGSIDDWGSTSPGNNGVFNNVGGGMDNPSGGKQGAYINAGVTIYQLIGTVVDNRQYTINFSGGTAGTPSTMIAKLFAGSGATPTDELGSASSTVTIPNSYVTFSKTITLGTTGFATQNLFIAFTGGTGARFLDNVSASFEPVPEPSALILSSLAIVGLLAAGRQRLAR